MSQVVATSFSLHSQHLPHIIGGFQLDTLTIVQIIIMIATYYSNSSSFKYENVNSLLITLTNHGQDIKGTVSRYKGRALLFLKSTAKRDVNQRHSRDRMPCTTPIAIDRASPVHLMMAANPKKKAKHRKDR